MNQHTKKISFLVTVLHGMLFSSFILCIQHEDKPTLSVSLVALKTFFYHSPVMKSSPSKHVVKQLGLITKRTESRAKARNKIQFISLGNKNKIDIPLLKILHDAIAEKQSYPESALLLKQTGVVTIGFMLYPNGEMTDIFIKKSSGVDSIDQAALEAARLTSPVKQVSAYLEQAGLFSLDVQFIL
jgi:TonB family protein